MKKTLVVFLLALPMFSAFCEDFPRIKLVPDLRFWGADLRIEYADFLLTPQALTSLEAEFGGGYEEFGFYRTPDTGLYTPPVLPDDVNLAKYQNINVDWGLGFRQGFFYNPQKRDNLLEAHLLYRGGYDRNFPKNSPGALIYQSGLADAWGNLINSLALGLFFDLIYRNSHEASQGVSISITGEWAPLFLANNLIGRNDFQRLTLDFRGFLTVLDLKNEANPDLNRFNIYLGDRVVFDALFGDSIPILTRQSVGGRELSLESSLGGVVRGIPSRRFDGYLKLVNNFDVRFNLPCIDYFCIPVQPGWLVYFDSAVKDNMDYKIMWDEIYNSTGLSFFLTIPWVDLILSFDYFINENRIDISYGFSFHYN